MDAPRLGRCHEIDRQAEPRERRLGPGGLVAGDPEPIARLVERPQAARRVGIEVAGGDPVADPGGLALAQLLGEVEAGPEDPEWLAMVRIAAGDDRAADREKREPRNPEPVGPRRPRPRLVDDRLTDIEDDRLKGHRRSVRICPAT